MFLVFINELGPNYKGDNLYEFIFTDKLEEVWDNSWDSSPSNGYPKPPDIEYISKVGILKDSIVKLDLIQNSDFFGFTDSVDDVIALGWEKLSMFSEIKKTKRLVFRFGETEDVIKDKLYERDLVLDFLKN
jgi:hypothetical protein